MSNFLKTVGMIAMVIANLTGINILYNTKETANDPAFGLTLF